MNIHPIFVHFPIALLTVYSVLEFVRFKKIIEKSWYLYVKGAFLIIGVLTSSLALQTGELAQEAYRGSDTLNLIRIHSNWASAASSIFTLLAILYVIHFVVNSSLHEKIKSTFLKPLWEGVVFLSEILFNSTWFVVLTALVGLAAITITGALGGAIVYGPDVDPVVKIIYSLLVK